MIDFVVWGAGLRGKRISKLLGANVLAYIDKTYQLRPYFEGKPVISFEEYKKKYFNCPIIISPLFPQEIWSFLAEFPEIPFISTVEEPSEISLGLPIPFEKIDFKLMCGKSNIKIYGINIFSLLLYDYLKEYGVQNVAFIPGRKGLNKKQAKVLKIDLAEQVSDKDIILCTEKNLEDVSVRFPANRVEEFWNLAMQVKAYHNNELKRFYNKHSGSRLFIVATGPSLMIKDLDLLYNKHEITMSVNMVYRCFGMTKWRPDYYLFEDMYGLKEYESEVMNLNLPNMFLPNVGVSGWSAEKKLGDNIFIYHLVSDRMNGWPRFSSDVSKYVSGGRTVIYSCIQLACYMGFKEIYLIGADCNYKGSPQDEGNHFIDGYCRQDDKQPKNQFPVTESFVGYQAARHYAEERGIKIFNATRGGKLEVFERVDFDSLF